MCGGARQASPPSPDGSPRRSPPRHFAATHLARAKRAAACRRPAGAVRSCTKCNPRVVRAWDGAHLEVRLDWKNPIPIRLAALTGATPPGESLTENKPFGKEDHPRSFAALESYESDRAKDTTRLPVHRAELEAQAENLERELTALPRRVSTARRLGFEIVSIGALGADGALCFIPAANMAGIPLSELDSASPIEATIMVAFCGIVVGANMLLGKFAARLLVTERSPWGAAVAVTLLLGNALVAYVRVGRLATALDLAEWVIFGFIPPLLGLAASLLAALVERSEEPAHAKADEIRALRLAIADNEEKLRDAWRERMRTAAVLDGLPADGAPLVPLERPAATPSWVAAGVVGIVLALGGFLFSGCGGSAEVPLAMGVLVDTSESMRALPPGKSAADAVRAADAAGGLSGGSELFMFETGKSSVERLDGSLVIPRRFTPRGDPKAERAELLDAFTSGLEVREWTEGDSLVVQGLGEVGEQLAAVPAGRRVAILLSDGRGFQAGPGGYYLGGAPIPTPESFVARIEDLGQVPSLDAIEVLLCGAGTHRSEHGQPFTSKQNAAVLDALGALVERGGGTLSVAPGCSRADLTRALKALDHGGDK